MHFLPKRASWLTIFAFSALNLAYFSFVVFWWLSHPDSLTIWIETASKGLLNQTLCLFFVPIVCLIFIFLIRIIKLKPADIGLRRDNLLAGMGIAVAFWSIAQLAHVGFVLANHRGLNLNYIWTSMPFAFDGLGSYISLYAGNAFYEEVAFRGFLLTQILSRVMDTGKWNQRNSIIISILSSQLIFAIIHLPSNTNSLHPIALFLEQFVFGILLALIYLMSRNLWICIGLHALLNGPPPIMEPLLRPASAGLIALVAIVIIAGWTSRGKKWLAEIRENPVPLGILKSMSQEA
ncbi:MAG: CPBP family intramembrane glutamic endopeptidase [Chthonomonadales bacterium]